MAREGALPDREMSPDGGMVKDGEQLEKAQSDGTYVDEAFVGFDLAEYGCDVAPRLPVKVLGAWIVVLLGHRPQPEVVEEGP